MNMEEMLRQRASVKQKYVDADQLKKDTKKELDDFDAAIFARFEAEGVTSVKIAGLANFVMADKVYASILPDKKEQGMAAIKRHYPDLVNETINGNTLSAFVRDAMKNDRELPADISECLKVSPKKELRQLQA